MFTKVHFSGSDILVLNNIIDEKSYGQFSGILRIVVLQENSDIYESKRKKLTKIFPYEFC